MLVYKGDERAPRALKMLDRQVGRGVGLALDLPLDLVEVKAQEAVLIFKMRVERRAADERAVGFLLAQFFLFFHDSALLYAHRIISNKRHERNKR